VVIDYRWYESGLPIDANGRYLPVTSKYPSATGSNGFKPLADKIHAMGLGFGIHIMRGIPRKSYDANTPIANSTFKAQDAGDTTSPCPWDQHMWGVHGDTQAGQDWYNSIMSQYAGWGVDFIKIDDMVNNDTQTYHQAEVDAIAKAIKNSGRSIVLSLSPGPMQTAWATNLNTNANIWRMVNDFWDFNGLSTLADVFTAAGNWQGITSLTQGHWPDGDMLPLGYLGPRNEWHASGQTTFTKNEQVTIMSLWSIVPSPLIYGGNVVSLASDDWTTALLTNEEVMAVNQDSRGTHGKRVAQQGSTEVWSRDLSGGRKAVALFNRGTQDATVTASFSQLGVTGTPVVRDLWHRADVTGMTTGLSVTVPYSGALMYTLSPSGGGTGGASGAGGASGTGGSKTGGTSGAGGAIGAGGMTGTGGASSSGAGGTTVGGTGGTTAGGTGGSSSVVGSGGSVAGGSGGRDAGTVTGSGGNGSGGTSSNGSGGLATGSGGSTTGAGGGNGGGQASGGTIANGTGGSATTSAGNAASSGCSCRIASAGDANSSLPWIVLCFGATAVWRRRRRR